MPRTAYLYRPDPPRFRPLAGGADVLLTLPDSFQLGVTQPGPGQFIGAVESRTENYPGTFTPQPNTIYRDLAFTGSFITVSVPGVEFENCLFAPTQQLITDVSSNARGVVQANSTTAPGLALRRCTVRPQTRSNNLTAVYARDFTAERCDVSNTTDGFATQGRAVLLGNYGHDFTFTTAAYQKDGIVHPDFFQCFGGAGTRVRGNFSDMRPGPLSDIPAPSTSSSGGIGQHIAFTPTAGVITDFLSELNWRDYGYRGVGGAAGANTGGSITLQLDRYGPNIARFPVTGYGSSRRAIVVDPGLNLIGLPATGIGVPDTTNGNVNYDGTPALVFRQTP